MAAGSVKNRRRACRLAGSFDHMNRSRFKGSISPKMSTPTRPGSNRQVGGQHRQILLFLLYRVKSRGAKGSFFPFPGRCLRIGLPQFVKLMGKRPFRLLQVFDLLAQPQHLMEHGRRINLFISRKTDWLYRGKGTPSPVYVSYTSIRGYTQNAAAHEFLKKILVIPGNFDSARYKIVSVQDLPQPETSIPAQEWLLPGTPP